MHKNYYICDIDHILDKNFFTTDSFSVAHLDNYIYDNQKLSQIFHCNISSNIKNLKNHINCLNNSQFNLLKNTDNNANCVDLYSDFIVIGRLYRNQILNTLTSAQLIILSGITDLSFSKFAKTNNGITLSTLLKKLNNLFSIKQLKRHLESLSKQKIIEIIYQKDDKSYVNKLIKLSYSLNTRTPYIPIILPKKLKLTHSQIIIYSLLLNKGSFFKRADTDFILKKDSLKKLLLQLPHISFKTLQETVKKFLKDNLLISGKYNSIYSINENVEAAYSKVFNIVSNNNAKEKLAKVKEQKQEKSKEINFVLKYLTNNGYFKAKYFAEAFLDENINNTLIFNENYISSLSSYQIQEIKLYKRWIEEINLANLSKTVFKDQKGYFFTLEKNHLVNKFEKKIMFKNKMIIGDKYSFPQPLEKKGLSYKFGTCYEKKELSHNNF